MPNHHPSDQYAMTQPPSNPYRTSANPVDVTQGRASIQLDVQKATLTFHCLDGSTYGRIVFGHHGSRFDEDNIPASVIPLLSKWHKVAPKMAALSLKEDNDRGFAEAFEDIDTDNPKLRFIPIHQIRKVDVTVEPHVRLFVACDDSPAKSNRPTHGGPG